MNLGLRHKNAIILAATKGLGRAVTEALASEGCDVAICARNKIQVKRFATELQNKFNIRAFGFSCDVSDRYSLRKFFNRTLDTLGSVDILITNTGGPPTGKIEEFDDRAWQAAIDLVLMSVIRSCRYVLPIMKKKRFGRIINLTSVSAKEPLYEMVLSNTLRAAVTAYSKSLAMEVAPFGILVNCVMPGSFLTDRNRKLGAAIAARRGILFEKLVKEWGLAVPIGRMGDPVEFGNMVAFLASEKCTFTTGACIPVEGGQIKGLI